MSKRIDEIIRNTTVVYTGGTSEQFEALHLIQKGAIIG